MGTFIWPRREAETIYISSSISNFRDKLLARTELPEWNWKSLDKHTVFFGLYHEVDYVRFLLHRGKKTVFWCGGDILNLQKKLLWQWILVHVSARHICENSVESALLGEMGFSAEICPMIFDNPKTVAPSFSPSENPQVYLCCHPTYEEQYGVTLVEGIASAVPSVCFHIYGVEGKNRDNVKFHGKVENDVFNREISGFQAGLRLNDMDGFSEVLAKSVLMGQYPISRIHYPMIDHASDITQLINKLHDLKNHKKPNTDAREYWLYELERNLCEVLS